MTFEVCLPLTLTLALQGPEWNVEWVTVLKVSDTTLRNFPALAFCDPASQHLVSAPSMPALPRSLSSVPGFTKEATNLPSRPSQRLGCTQPGPWSGAFHPLEVLRGLRGWGR